MGFLLTLIPEFIYLMDIFNSRMNIVFKLYYQAWVMFALGAAIGLVVLINAARAVPTVRVALAAATTVIVIGGVGAAVVGAHQWNSWRLGPDHGWIGMDGLHFLETEPRWAGEADAVDWLYENARDDDVMLTVGGCEWANDIGLTASASGVPAILGWDGHERQWHLGEPGFDEDIVQRTADIESLWTTLDPVLLDRYDVTLVFIGPLETNGPIVSQVEAGRNLRARPVRQRQQPGVPRRRLDRGVHQRRRHTNLPSRRVLTSNMMAGTGALMLVRCGAYLGMPPRASSGRQRAPSALLSFRDREESRPAGHGEMARALPLQREVPRKLGMTINRLRRGCRCVQLDQTRWRKMAYAFLHHTLTRIKGLDFMC